VRTLNVSRKKNRHEKIIFTQLLDHGSRFAGMTLNVSRRPGGEVVDDDDVVVL
jgi:hypothetical protein